MPRQNRVSPFGMIVADPARGTLMGNRGCLHDDRDHPVRQYEGRRWIICLIHYKDRHRQAMPPGEYTSLFFLDEATALAAGHRPCAQCQWDRFSAFRAHWAAANPQIAGGPVPSVDTIDAALHRERISDHHYQCDKVKLTYIDRLDALPDGTFILLATSDIPYLVHGNALYPWSFAGYGQPIARPTTTVQVLTPHSTMRTLAHGYTPCVHPTAHPLY